VRLPGGGGPGWRRPGVAVVGVAAAWRRRPWVAAARGGGGLERRRPEGWRPRWRWPGEAAEGGGGLLWWRPEGRLPGCDSQGVPGLGLG
jgi:hypothetical protein